MHQTNVLHTAVFPVEHDRDASQHKHSDVAKVGRRLHQPPSLEYPNCWILVLDNFNFGRRNDDRAPAQSVALCKQTETIRQANERAWIQAND